LDYSSDNISSWVGAGTDKKWGQISWYLML